MRTLIALAFSIAALAGCTTPAEQAAIMNQEMDRMILVYGPACDKLGFQAATDQWRNCILQLSTKDEMDRYYSRPYTYPYPSTYPYSNTWPMWH